MIKKFDDRPACDLMHDEIFSFKREKILSGIASTIQLKPHDDKLIILK